jgi:hypothetical protein
MTNCLRVLLLTATLAAPVAMVADDKVVVFHDDRHHDTHEWNKDEDGRYKAYLEEKHMKYREFKHLSRKDQDNYWAWRHDH